MEGIAKYTITSPSSTSSDLTLLMLFKRHKSNSNHFIVKKGIIDKIIIGLQIKFSRSVKIISFLIGVVRLKMVELEKVTVMSKI